MFKKFVRSLVRKELSEWMNKYITDVNDTKSDYLKRYFETRLDSSYFCINQSQKYLQGEIWLLKDRIDELESHENEQEDT